MDGGCRVGLDCEIVGDPVKVNRSSNDTVVVVELPFDPPTSGGSNTCSGGIFDELSRSASTCQAGCCIDGGCVCRDGYVGGRCDVQLRCGATASADADTFDLDACATIELPEERRAICSCSDLEFVAVLAQRLQPTSALLDALDDEWPRDMREALFEASESSPTSEIQIWIQVMLVLYVSCSSNPTLCLRCDLTPHPIPTPNRSPATGATHAQCIGV